jgi:Fe-S cluster assembly ATP-binding protein
LIYQSILTLKEKDSSIVLITHYPQILDYIKPDYSHVIINGKIVESDNKNLIEKIVKNGYDIFFEKDKA